MRRRCERCAERNGGELKVAVVRSVSNYPTDEGFINLGIVIMSAPLTSPARTARPRYANASGRTSSTRRRCAPLQSAWGNYYGQWPSVQFETCQTDKAGLQGYGVLSGGEEQEEVVRAALVRAALVKWSELHSVLVRAAEEALGGVLPSSLTLSGVLHVFLGSALPCRGHRQRDLASLSGGTS